MLAHILGDVTFLCSIFVLRVRVSMKTTCSVTFYVLPGETVNPSLEAGDFEILFGRPDHLLPIDWSVLISRWDL